MFSPEIAYIQTTLNRPSKLYLYRGVCVCVGIPTIIIKRENMNLKEMIGGGEVEMLEGIKEMM